MIDPAILRPGRIDAHIFCDLPSEDDRREFLNIQLQQHGITPTAEELEVLIIATKGFSFADIDLGCKTMQISQEGLGRRKIVSQLTDNLLKVKSISQSKEFNKLRHIYEAFREHKLTTDLAHQKQVLK